MIKEKVKENQDGLPELKLLFVGQAEVEPGKVIPFECYVNFEKEKVLIKTQNYELELLPEDLTIIAVRNGLFELEKHKAFRPLTKEERGI